jgi:Cu/Ag efflux protein CusF
MKLLSLLILAASTCAANVLAQQAPAVDHDSHHAQAAQAGGELLSEGEVRKVDPATGKITLRHGPLANLDMPAMTMVFTATDPKLLQGLKQGDKVRFTADKSKDGTYLVTAIRVAN